MTLAAITAGVLAPYAGIVIAAFTFFASQREFRRRAKVDAVIDHEKRIVLLERENKALVERVEACERDRVSLKDENYRLMSRVINLEGRST